MSEFKYLGFVLDESRTNVAKCCRKVVSGSKVLVTIRSLFNAWGLHLSVEGAGSVISHACSFVWW